MWLLLILFFISLLFGQLIRIPLFGGAALYSHDIVLGVIVMYWIIKKCVLGKNSVLIVKKKLTLFFPLKLFLAAMLLSLAVNMSNHTLPEIGEALGYVMRFIFYASLYPIIATEENKKQWLIWLYGIGVVYALLGFLQYALYPNLRNLMYLGWDPHYYRLFSTFLDPNFSGLFIILTFIIGIYLFHSGNRKRIILIFQEILSLSLLLTLSRSSYVAFMTVLIVYGIMKRSYTMLVILLLFIGIILCVPFPGTDITKLFRTDSSAARIQNWSESLALIQQKPLFGYGFNFLRTVRRESPLPTGSESNENGIESPSTLSHSSGGLDNSFLFVFATTGIVGFLAWIYLLCSMSKQGVVLLKRKNPMGETVILSLLSISIHSLFVNSFFYPWILIWLWSISGIVEQKEKEK